MKKILITGANGQLGRALKRTAPDFINCILFNRESLDITQPNELKVVFEEWQPDAVINAAAYTEVDKAEEDIKEAVAINQNAVALLAQLSSDFDIPLLHVSTDFVFDGFNYKPYVTSDTPHPGTIYGKTKLAGEEEVLNLHKNSLIMRTAWVYSADGNNFVKTMIGLMQSRSEIRVVADQIGTPTSVNGLAKALWASLEKELTGIYHWTDAGVASWYDFAVAIAEEGLKIGLVKKPIKIYPIRSIDYPTPASRPFYSVLDKTATWAELGVMPNHWREELREVLLNFSS